MNQIIYSLREPKTAGLKFGSPDPVKAYLRHYMNGLVLFYLLQHSKQFEVRARVEAELQVCERKQKYWYRLLDGKNVEECHTACKKHLMSWIADYADYL